MPSLQSREIQEMERIARESHMICRACREQLLTDEAVENVANAMHADDLAHEHCAHVWGEYPETDEWYRRNARAAINALLEEET